MSQKQSGIVIPHQLRWHGRLAAWFIAKLIRALAATLRFEIAHPESGWDPGFERAIFTLWHSRLAVCLPVYHRIIRPHAADRRLAALISASKDGALLASVLENFGVRPVRGSSSRRGAQALLELSTLAAERFDIAVTPDGPRGPAEKAQPGAIALAAVTGLPIIPVSWDYSQKARLRSWDRFQIPLPFSKCVICFWPALRVPREASEDLREQLRQELQRRLQGNV